MREKKVDDNLFPLSKEEAIEAMQAGERLVDGIGEYWHFKYHWCEGHILKSDNYEDLYGEGNIIEIEKMPLLYRNGERGNFTNKNAEEEYWKDREKK